MKKHSFFNWVFLMIMLMSNSSRHTANAQSEVREEPINLSSVGFTSSKLQTSVGEIAVFEAGQGEPVLLLHGVGAGASSFIWFTIAPELAKTHRVIAPDFVGWGESYRPDRDVLFEDYVTQIKEIVQWIGEPVQIVTQSLTSGFTIKAINEANLNVTKLALFSPSGGKDFGVDAFGEQVTEQFYNISQTPQREQFYIQAFHQKPAVENWWRREGFLNGENVPEEIIENNFYNARQPNASYSAIPFLNGTLRYNIAPLISDIETPAIIVWGEGEFRINKDVQNKLNALNPDVEVYTINNARTAFEVEQPAQTLRILNSFFDNN